MTFHTPDMTRVLGRTTVCTVCHLPLLRGEASKDRWFVNGLVPVPKEMKHDCPGGTPNMIPFSSWSRYGKEQRGKD